MPKRASTPQNRRAKPGLLPPWRDHGSREIGAGPETPARRAVIRSIAVVALAASAAYLVWRALFTLGNDLWLAVPLWFLELDAAASLALFTFSLWDLDSAPVPPPVEHTKLRIAVVIPTFNEPREVLLPTVAAAVALAPAHETWVLDDGGREWVQDLAESLGAHYLARKERQHAKAGNINYALERLEADLVAFFDADHVATPDFLTHTLGYFADPKLAVVQTPQDFYNVDSFEHDRNRSWFWPKRRPIPFSEQRLFYRAIQPGKNRIGAAFWCGTNALVRVSALREVGGVACGTVTEDIHTTVRLHRLGWRTVYHNEVLAYGLAAKDAEQYHAQRFRWGTGAMQLMRTEHPLSDTGLTLGQRVAYAATLLGWFDAWRTLGYVLVPIAVVLSGANPIHAHLGVFLAAFGSTFLLQRAAIGFLSRGYAPQGMATLFEFVRMQSNIAATLTYLRQGERPFRVTNKHGALLRHRNKPPGLLVTLIGLSAVGLTWFALSLAGITGVSYQVRWVAYGAVFWLLFNAVMLVAAVSRIRSERFSTDRRSAVRLRVGAPVSIDGEAGDLLDVSIGGALVRSKRACGTGGMHELRIKLGGEKELELRCEERSRQPVGSGGALLGLRFIEGQDRELGHLAIVLAGGRPTPARPVVSEVPAA